MADRVNLDPAALRRLLTDPSGLVGRDVLRRGRRVADAARRNVNSRTGRLAASITVELVAAAGVPTARVAATAPYARAVHEGRGPVRARRGRVLAFPAPGGGVVFTRSVGSARPRPFLVNALREAVR